MAFCAKCGTQLAEGVSFCASCGTPVGSGAGGPATPAGAGTAMSSNVAGLLTYALGPITGVVFLLLEPYRQDKFVRFHAFQSILFGIAWGVFFSVLGLLLSLLTVLTFGLGAFVHLGVMLLFILASFLFWLFLAFKAYSNERFMVPYI